MSPLGENSENVGGREEVRPCLLHVIRQTCQTAGAASRVTVFVPGGLSCLFCGGDSC